MAIKCQENWPNGHKIYRHLPLQDPPRFTQIGVWGLKIYHLATLVCRAEPSLPQKRYLEIRTSRFYIVEGIGSIGSSCKFFDVHGFEDIKTTLYETFMKHAMFFISYNFFK
jgi:hypothetical protein